MKNNKNKRFKEGDIVTIISGKDKGKKGKIINISCNNQLKVEGINIQTKHIKPKQNEEKGEIKKIEGPIHQSNVKIINIKK